MTGRRTLLALAILSLTGIYFAFAAAAPDSLGFWQDDGIYLVTARSLAAGEGYRHLEMPGRPLQTKYPPLWPATLALALAAWPDPRAAWLPGALAAATFVVLAGVYLRRVLDLPRPLVLAATALAAVSPSLLSMVRFTLSEHLYAALAVLALLAADGRAAECGSPVHRRLAVGAAAAAAAAALLTRAIGVTLAVAVVVALALRRRFRAAAGAAAGIAFAWAPWAVWQQWAAARNGSLAAQPLLGEDLGYGAWAPGGVGDLVRAAGENLVRVGYGLARYELALPESWMETGSPARVLLAHGLAWLGLGVVLIGVVATARERRRTVHLYLLLYAALVLSWPFEPFRFLVVWTPFLLGFLLAGVARSAAAVTRRPRAAHAVVAVTAAALGVLFLAEDRRLAASDAGAFRYAGRTSAALAEDAASFDFVRRATRPDDVIASALPARLFLTTGRAGVCLWHDSQPYRLYSGPERTWLRFFLDGDTTALVRSQMEAELESAYRDTGVRWLLLERESAPAALVELVGARPDLFRWVWSSPRGSQALYELAPR